MGRSPTNEAAARLRRLLTSFAWIPTLAPTGFERATRVYRTCRRQGREPGGMIECMIEKLTIRTESTFLAGDAGVSAMAQVVPLAIEPVEP